MIDFLLQASADAQAQSCWEYIAVILSLTYLVLAMRQSIWCWPAAFGLASIYAVLFYNSRLYMDSLLQIYYILMAIYGWYTWRYPSSMEQQPQLPIQSWSWPKHVFYIVVTLAIATMIGYIMDNYTQADFAYLDSITTCFSLITTYMLVKKVLEHWVYWVIIDCLSIYLYFYKGFYPTTILFALYTLLAIWGYVAWRRSYHQDQLSQQI